MYQNTFTEFGMGLKRQVCYKIWMNLEVKNFSQDDFSYPSSQCPYVIQKIFIRHDFLLPTVGGAKTGFHEEIQGSSERWEQVRRRQSETTQHRVVKVVAAAILFLTLGAYILVSRAPQK